MPLAVAAFYKFVTISDRDDLKRTLLSLCAANAARGSILVASEGINGTIAGPAEGMRATLNAIRADARFRDMDVKWSTASEPPFARLKVRLKSEIVTLGRPEADPNVRVGIYVDSLDWNAVISDPDMVVLDTRNAYEVAIGTFERAINPRSQTFGELPAFVSANLAPSRHRKVAMFCTGGIRCEKASAYMLAQGFEQVYHLRGGILAYLEAVPPQQSMWRGECYVFDGRVALGHGLTYGTHDMRRACGHPVAKGAGEGGADGTCPMCAAMSLASHCATARKAGCRPSRYR